MMNIYTWGDNCEGQCGIGSLEYDKIFECKKIKFDNKNKKCKMWWIS